MTTARSLKWIALGQGVKIGSQLVNMFVLTRFISPVEYGLMAMAVIATNLGLILRDLGTSAAVIQKETISNHELSTAFWSTLTQGFVIFILLAALSPAISLFFAQPKLTAVLLFLSISFPIASIGAIHQAILERRSDFKIVATIETVGSTIALFVALALVWAGCGVYSLVGQAITTAAVTSTLLWKKSKWKPTLYYSRNDARSLFKFGGSMTGYQLASYAFRNADSIIVGKILGATGAGVYSLANKIMLFPVQNISWATTRALFPAMSRLQEETEALKLLFLKSTSNVSFLCAPLMFGIASVSDLFISTTLNEKWHEISNFLPYLAIVGYIQVATGVTGPVFMATGKTKLLFKLAILNAGTHIFAYWLGATYSGNLGVSVSYLIASATIAIPTVTLCSQQLKISLREYIKYILPPTIGGLLVFATSYLTQKLIQSHWKPTDVILLCLCILTSTAIYVAYSFVFQKTTINQFSSSIRGRA